MARRSTRNRIRYQFEQIIKRIDAMERHLQKADSIAAGNHPRLNDALPSLIWVMDRLRERMAEFRDTL